MVQGPHLPGLIIALEHRELGDPDHREPVGVGEGPRAAEVVAQRTERGRNHRRAVRHHEHGVTDRRAGDLTDRLEFGGTEELGDATVPTVLATPQVGQAARPERAHHLGEPTLDVATGATRRSIASTRPSAAPTSMSTPEAGPPRRWLIPGPSLLPTHPALPGATSPRNPRMASTVIADPTPAIRPPRHSCR